jgi:uncharacterized membrane protein/rubredoxin
MKKMVRCKACGYIIEEGKLADRCPACGAPKTAFMPYIDPMSAARRRFLKMDLHPIAVHFPISLTVAVLVFIIALALISGEGHTLLIDTSRILVLIIPVMTIIAGVLGFIDGKVRFRKIKNSTILQRKILYATILFIDSAVLAVIIWKFGFDTIISTSVAAFLAAIALGLVIVLSLLGTSILEAAFPGK